MLGLRGGFCTDRNTENADVGQLRLLENGHIVSTALVQVCVLGSLLNNGRGGCWNNFAVWNIR